MTADGADNTDEEYENSPLLPASSFHPRHEDGSWKLVSINVKVKPPADKAGKKTKEKKTEKSDDDDNE